MKIETRFHDHVCILAIHGKMMGGPESNKIYEEIKSQFENGTHKFIIDMKNVKWLNSGGIGVLMRIFTMINNAGGSICLADLSEEAESLLTLTQLIQIFRIFEGVDEALNDFR